MRKSPEPTPHTAHHNQHNMVDFETDNNNITHNSDYYSNLLSFCAPAGPHSVTDLRRNQKLNTVNNATNISFLSLLHTTLHFSLYFFPLLLVSLPGFLSLYLVTLLLFCTAVSKMYHICAAHSPLFLRLALLLASLPLPPPLLPLLPLLRSHHHHEQQQRL